MREELISQYTIIQETLNTNIQTIGKLLDQADKLKNTISGMTGDNQLKSSLESQIAQLDESIKSLIQQTSKLLDSHSAFVKLVFEHK